MKVISIKKENSKPLMTIETGTFKRILELG
jgi:hypothetical protein